MVLVSVERNVGCITLNRPEKRNALTRAMVEQILEALATFERRDEVRVVLFRGVGTAFCSGLDLADMQARVEQIGWFDYGLMTELFSGVARYPAPTVAMVQGSAVAGGCELALHCDVRIGSPSARFAMPLAKLGLVIPAGAAERLVQAIGVSAARDMLLTGDAIDGVRAERIGLLSRIVDRNQLEATTEHVVRVLAQNAPLALRAMKQVLDRLGPRLSVADHAEFDAERLRLSRGDDMREGLQAFFERRPPVFRSV